MYQDWEKYLPSKNKQPNIPFFPLMQIPGVLITAAVLALLTHHFESIYLTGKNIEFGLYPILIFFGVLSFYSADHIRDLFVTKLYDTKYKKAFVLNFIVLILSLIILSIYTLLKWEVLIENKMIYIPLFGIVFYLILSQKNMPYIPGVKEVLIALTASASVLCSALGYNLNFNSIGMWLLLFLVFLSNVILFDYFEKEKDDILAFKTLFYLLGKEKAKTILYVIFTFITFVIILLNIFVTKNALGSIAIVVLYWMMIFFENKIKAKWIYRILADALLILIVL